MAFLDPVDLTAFNDGIDPFKAAEMIADATALAMLAAPCLGDVDNVLTAAQQAAVKAILRGAILRWNDSGTGALQAQTAGPFSQTYDTRQTRRSLFWPSEIEQLQSICKGSDSGSAFSIDTAMCAAAVHADVCAVNFGALYCSCGATLTLGFPLWEV